MPLLVDDTVDIYVAAIVGFFELRGEGQQDFSCEFRLLDIAQDGALLAGRRPHVAGHQLLELEILLEAFVPAAGTEPSGDAHLYAFDELLEDEGGLELVELLPPFEHEDHVVGT